MIAAPILSELAGLVIGSLSLVYAGRLAWRSWRARHWTTVEGKILSADLKRRKHSAQTCVLDVHYQYTVGADTYTGIVISPDGGPTYFNEELGRLAIAQQWQPGTTVKVYVNPRDPEDAMLAPRVSLPIYLGLFAGAALIAGAMFDLLSG
jgi:hypothetical protein